MGRERCQGWIFQIFGRSIKANRRTDPRAPREGEESREIVLRFLALDVLYWEFSLSKMKPTDVRICFNYRDRPRLVEITPWRKIRKSGSIISIVIEISVHIIYF